MSCPDASAWVDYFAGDLAEAESAALDAHLFSCLACTAAAERAADVVTALRAMVLPLISVEELARLRRRGLRITEQTLTPGGPHQAPFPTTADLLIFRLSGLDLGGAARVAFVMRDEASGHPLMPTVEAAPFDRDSGQVLVACQKHFVAFPPNTVAEVRIVDETGRESVATYTIHHHFVPA